MTTRRFRPTTPLSVGDPIRVVMSHAQFQFVNSWWALLTTVILAFFLPSPDFGLAEL